MKIETENAIRSIAATDPDVNREILNQAIDILNGKAMVEKAQESEPLVKVIRFTDVCDLLKIHRMTLQYYLSKGYLDRVYGAGKRALGISRDSYIRFTTERRIVKNKPCKHRRRKAGVRDRAHTKKR